mgnify:CR=1 FL=1
MLTKEEREAIKEQEKLYKKQARAQCRGRKRKEPEPAEMENQREDLPEEKKPFKKPSQKPSSDTKKILSVFPIRDYQDGFFLTNENRIIDIFQVQGRSYFDASDDEIETMVYDFTKLLRKYSADLKFIGMNYPTNTRLQQAFLTEKLKQPALEKYEDILQEKLAALQTLEQTTTDREAFLMLFADNRDQYDTLCKLLSKASAFSIKTMSREKKESILFQLNNMCKCVKI